MYNFIINEYKNLKEKTELKENENLISDNIFVQLEKIKNRKVEKSVDKFLKQWHNIKVAVEKQNNKEPW